MPRQVKKKCGRCKYLFTKYGGFGECWYTEKSSGMEMKACSKFKEGPPLVPVYKGKKARVVPFDPQTPTAFIIQSSERQMLALMWDRDKDDYGYWRIKQIGLSSNNGPITKQLTPDKEDTAFYGEAAIVGAKRTDLYRTDGYEDFDDRDEDDTVTNKPVEIRIYPRRHEDEE